VEAARRATAADVPRLAALVAEAVAEQVEARGGRIWAAREARAVPAEASLGLLVDDPDALVLAGTIDGSIVGYAVAHLEALRTGEGLGVVTDVYVEPGAREVGVGEALLDEVVAWCEAAGNRHTKNFFESFSFTARAIVVHRRLR
jgi:GNAT superfamily N-acetyltransferase